MLTATPLNEEIIFNDEIIVLEKQGTNRFYNLNPSNFHPKSENVNVFKLNLKRFREGRVNIKLESIVFEAPVSFEIIEDINLNQSVIIYIEFNKCFFFGDLSKFDGVKFNKNKINITFNNCEFQLITFARWKFELIHFNYCKVRQTIELCEDIQLIGVDFVNTLGGGTYIDTACKIRVELFRDFIKYKENQLDTYFEIKEVQQLEIIGPYRHRNHEEETFYFPRFFFNIQSELNLRTDKIWIRYFEFEELKFQHLTIENLQINHSKSNYTLFNGIDAKLLKLEEFDFEGDQRAFHLVDCQIEKQQWIKIHLKNLKILNIHKTEMSEVMFSDTEFPALIESRMWGEEDVTKEADRAELYRQLKLSAEKMKNPFLINTFNAGMYNAKKKDYRIKPEERVILTLNYLTNNHGNSVGYSLAWIVSLNVFFASLSIWILKGSYCAIFENGGSVLKNFFAFINISSSYNDLRITGDSLNLNHGLYAIFVLMKIINLWLAFQFVAAFRRFGMK